jgi:hypothetical protein
MPSSISRVGTSLPERWAIRNSGTWSVTGSLSESSPSSRAMTAAQAKKLFDKDAIGKTVSRLGRPDEPAVPKPLPCRSPAASVIP